MALEAMPDMATGITAAATPRTGRSAIAIQSSAVVKRRDKRNIVGAG
jgi:hypothetical protein